ncbi:hypothetical protein [Winogradskyella sp.]|uniref:hypothetical protein n=1 Tax=Winogradskyella sp. TaxID=1883156 RepID=UPI00260BCC55|nr:hypothetical protein [Winogradskyella sp.]
MSASLVNNNNVAEVEQMQGYYIFVDSKPISDYEYLGTVKSAITFSGQYQPVRDALLKKARKQFPNGDGIIFHFHNGGTDRADVIRFKK